MGPSLPGDTPWRAILLWAERRGLDDEAADFLAAMLRLIDAEHVAAVARKAKR